MSSKHTTASSFAAFSKKWQNHFLGFKNVYVWNLQQQSDTKSILGSVHSHPQVLCNKCANHRDVRRHLGCFSRKVEEPLNGVKVDKSQRWLDMLLFISDTVFPSLSVCLFPLASCRTPLQSCVRSCKPAWRPAAAATSQAGPRLGPSTWTQSLSTPLVVL